MIYNTGVLEKLTLLNEAVLKCLQESDRKKIAQNFVDVGIKILDADFGYSWIYSNTTKNFELAYTTPNLPYIPKPPKKGGHNVEALRTGQPYFVSKIYKRNDKHDLSRHMKAFVIIPMYFKGEMFGNIVICFKQEENFPKEKKILCTFLGNSIVQAIIINRLVKIDTLLREEKSKTEFIANATHELKTPLAIIKGNVDLALLDKKNPKLAQETLEKVDEEINILTEIFKDLAFLTSGQFTKSIINPVPVNVSKLVRNLAERLKIIAAQKDIKIKVNRESEDLFVKGDEIYLEKLFINPMKNAISYGKKSGHVIINIDSEKDKVKVEISDNGVGIPKEDLPKIFERFFRGDKSHTGSRTGLGLAITKLAAEIHDGTVEAKSTLGKGSTFTITLPKLMNQ